jgi:outer membrane protein
VPSLQPSQSRAVWSIMKAILLAAAAILAVTSPAAAQDDNDIRVRVGLGGQLEPKFIGSNDVEFGPLWDIDLARGTNLFPFESPDDSFGIRLFSKGGFTVGPAANIEWKRKESDVGAPVGKVKTTVEVGGFAEYLPSETIRLRTDLRKGLGGHAGLVGSFGADRIWRDGDRYVFSIGPRVLFSDAKYQRAYFGVDSAAALASGLPASSPSGGIHAVAAASGLSYQFSPKFGAFGFARYERLVGDAAKSPIVRDLGSRNQLSGGIGLSYTFTVKR